ncbi:hypothetical protein IAT38_007928 [Cryptococcus sp. DSM 104549]
MSQQPMAQQDGEEDWETGEIIVAPRTNNLRPTAHEFRPRPPTDDSTRDAVPGPSSRALPAGFTLLSRPPPGGQAASRGGDDVDDWFRGTKPATNRQIWESANSRSPSNTTIISPTPLPQPKVQLLRRPNSGSSTPSNNPSPLPAKSRTKTLEEREEEYKLARERIFGTSTPDADGGQARAAPDAARTPEGLVSGARAQPSSERKSQEGRRRDGPALRGVGSPGQSGGVLWDGLVPSQIRGTGRSPGAAGAGPKVGGVLRQPTGPGQGDGFGAGFGRGGGG